MHRFIPTRGTAAVAPHTTATRHAGGPGRTRRLALTALVGACLAGGQLVAVPDAQAAAASGAVARSRVVKLATALKGRPYRYGASGPRAFDCSGFTRYVYRRATGRALPHSAHRQQFKGRRIAKSQARPGDLIIFRSGGYGYHAAIYAGRGYMYDAPRPGVRVGKHRIWSRHYVVRRIV